MPAGLFIEYLNLSGFAQFHSRKFSWKARFVESAVYSECNFNFTKKAVPSQVFPYRYSEIFRTASKRFF